MRAQVKFLLLIAVLAVCETGCFSISNGISDMRLPIRVTGVPHEIVEVDQFDGIDAKVVRNGNQIKFLFVAKGRFRCRPNGNRTYRVPKKVSIGICPGVNVPTEGWQTPGLSPNAFGKAVLPFACVFFIVPLVDSLFVEPFSDYRSDINADNLAQLGLIGCCKYYDTSHLELGQSNVMSEGDGGVERTEYPLNGVICVHVDVRDLFVRTVAKIPVPLDDNGRGEIAAHGFSNAFNGVTVPVTFSQMPIIGGDLGDIIKRQCPIGKVFNLTLKEDLE